MNGKRLVVAGAFVVGVYGCGGGDESSTSSTVLETSTTSAPLPSASSVAVPTTSSSTDAPPETTTVGSTVSAPTTGVVSTVPSSTGNESYYEPRTEEGVLAAFDDYVELRDACYQAPDDCDGSSFHGRVSGRFLRYELTIVDGLTKLNGPVPPYDPDVELVVFDDENGVAQLSICDYIGDRSTGSMSPLVSVSAEYIAGRWVFNDLEAEEEPTCEL